MNNKQNVQINSDTINECGTAYLSCLCRLNVGRNRSKYFYIKSIFKTNDIVLLIKLPLKIAIDLHYNYH